MVTMRNLVSALGVVTRADCLVECIDCGGSEQSST